MSRCQEELKLIEEYERGPEDTVSFAYLAAIGRIDWEIELAMESEES